VLLACRWEGLDGREIGAGETRVRAFEDVLSIVGALKADAGNYTCVVENAAGVRRRPVSIVVSGQFRVTSTFSDAFLFSVIPLAVLLYAVSLPVWCIQYHSIGDARLLQLLRSCCRRHRVINSTPPHQSRHLFIIPARSVVTVTPVSVQNDRCT